MYIPVKRWRAYHRALKRDEPWAIKFSKLNPLNQMFTWIYRDEMFASIIYKKNPILDFIPKDDTWVGGFYSILFSVDNKVTFANVEKKEEEK